MQLYLNNSSIENNKYFKTHEELLSLSNKELQEIKEYKKRTGFLKNANKKLGKSPKIEYLEPRDEVKYAWCEHTRAKNILGFVDKTNLYNLIEETWDWAVQIQPKPVKSIEYEIKKGIYSYWR